MATASESATFTPFAKRIPAGPKSAKFNDLSAAKKRQINGIRSIKLWVDRVVVGMQVTYTLAGGKTFRAPVRGAKKGKVSWVRLKADEELIQLSAQGNTGSIRALTFLSTRVDGRVRLHGPFGPGEIATHRKGKPVKYRTHELLVGGSDDRGFSWYGGKIMAFTGATRDGRLNGLGVLTAPIVDVADGISSTSVLAEDYHEVRSGSRGQKKLKQYASYRSTVKLPADTKAVTLWAESQVRVEIGGRAKVLDPVKPTEVKPNALSQLTINVEAGDLSVPAIKIRSDQMTDVWQWYTLHPDVAAHEKIAAWDTDTLYANRSKLGISKKVSKKDCAAVQSAIANVVKLGLPSAGQAAHERSVEPKGMNDANWVLDFRGGKARYASAKKTEAKQAKKKVKRVRRVAAARGFFKDVGKGLSKAGSDIGKGVSKVGSDIGKGVETVVVETSKTKPVKDLVKTAKDVGKSDVVKSAGKLGKNVIKTGEQLGKDLGRGDFDAFGKHLGEGGLQLGRDVTRLGEHTVVTIVNAAGDAIEYVLDQAAAVGKFIVDLLESIGAQLKKIIDFLVDLLPWKAINRTQKQLQSMLERSLRNFASGEVTRELESRIDNGLAWLDAEGSAALDKATRSLGGKVKPSKKVAEITTAVGKAAGKVGDVVGGVASKATKWIDKGLEYLTWLIGKLVEKIPLVKDIAKVVRKAAKVVGKIVGEIGAAARAAGEHIPDGLATAITNLGEIAKDPKSAPVLLAAAMLQLVKAILGAGIELVRRLIGAVFGASKQLASLALELGRLDLFPGKKAKGNSIFVKIYNFVVGIDLSVFSVLTWLLAIPITLVHMAAFGKAPRFTVAKRGTLSGIYETSRTIGALVCSFLELGIAAFLDTKEVMRGASQYVRLVSEGETPPPDRSPLEIQAEWTSWFLAVLGHAFSEPFIFEPDEEKALEQWGWGVGALGLFVDLVALFAGGARTRRWDISGIMAGREGGIIALLIEGTQLTCASIVLLKTSASPAKIVADLSGGVSGVVASIFMIAVPQPSPHGAAAIAILGGILAATSLTAGLIDDFA